MSSDNGWISLHRTIRNHALWEPSRPRTKCEAWLDILMEANHSGNKVMLGGEILYCARGESLNSLDTWAARWKWSKPAVRRFFKMMTEDGMIALLNTTRKTTHLRVCNYEAYQDGRHSDETQMKLRRHSGGTQAALNNKDNNNNNANNTQGEGSEAEPVNFDEVGGISDFIKKLKDVAPWAALVPDHVFMLSAQMYPDASMPAALRHLAIHWSTDKPDNVGAVLRKAFEKSSEKAQGAVAGAKAPEDEQRRIWRLKDQIRAAESILEGTPITERETRRKLAEQIKGWNGEIVGHVPVDTKKRAQKRITLVNELTEVVISSPDQGMALSEIYDKHGMHIAGEVKNRIHTQETGA